MSCKELTRLLRIIASTTEKLESDAYWNEANMGPFERGTAIINKRMAAEFCSFAILYAGQSSTGTPLPPKSLHPKLDRFLSACFQKINVQQTPLYQYLNSLSSESRSQIQKKENLYESYLHLAGKEQKKQYGVFYTPPNVVSFTIRTCHEALCQRFDMHLGLASDKFHDGSPVIILDPALGTGIFLRKCIELIASLKKFNHDSWQLYIRNNLLPRLFGIEILPVPWAIAHLRITKTLIDSGFSPGSNDRLQIYLGDYLEEDFQSPLLTQSKGPPFSIIVGNPPYGIASEYKDSWSVSLLKKHLYVGENHYYECRGKSISESNLRWLPDRYVQFFRRSQYELLPAKHGILSFVCNHSWLDNQSFKGMRLSLSQMFSEIWLLDLHGNKKKHQNDDENLFQIQQGIAISWMLKGSNNSGILHVDKIGSRQAKNELLSKSHFLRLTSHQIKPERADQVWKNICWEHANEYMGFPSLTTYFQPTSGKRRWAKGLATTKDKLYISWDDTSAQKKIALLAGKLSNERLKDKLNIVENQYFPLNTIRKKIRQSDWKNKFKIVNYRPYDKRIVYWHPELFDIGRGASSWRVTEQLLQPNIALLTSRMTKGESFRHVFVTTDPTEVIFLSSRSSNNCFVFPLFHYQQATRKGHNLHPTILQAFQQITPLASPHTIFNYIYTVLHCPQYRKRYADLLTLDFPRIPYPQNSKVFHHLSQFGQQLIAIQLQKEAASSNIKVHGEDYLIRKIVCKDALLWINESTYIGPLSEEIFHYKIGGYQVSTKWLKQRKKKPMSKNDMDSFVAMLRSVEATIELVDKISAYVKTQGGWINIFRKEHPTVKS